MLFFILSILELFYCKKLKSFQHANVFGAYLTAVIKISLNFYINLQFEVKIQAQNYFLT